MFVWVTSNDPKCLNLPEIIFFFLFCLDLHNIKVKIEWTPLVSESLELLEDKFSKIGVELPVV